ncbi:hypothetical protein CN135_27910 [Sinorhizobium meliloti]|nr:hypothetical protein [Sinorhizobium meliloti]MDW9502237.1 hypothetical protein [Sinorhizobium meliloti]RVL73557.1 hypothetical protein CN135_27910 [Sinorhizobium meliloti]
MIEAKDNNHGVGDWMQQGLNYAATLDIYLRLFFNGDGLLFHDRTSARATKEANLGLDRRSPICGATIAPGMASTLKPNRLCFLNFGVPLDSSSVRIQ